MADRMTGRSASHGASAAPTRASCGTTPSAQRRSPYGPWPHRRSRRRSNAPCRRMARACRSGRRAARRARLRRTRPPASAAARSRSTSVISAMTSSPTGAHLRDPPEAPAVVLVEQLVGGVDSLGQRGRRDDVGHAHEGDLTASCSMSRGRPPWRRAAVASASCPSRTPARAPAREAPGGPGEDGCHAEPHRPRCARAGSGRADACSAGLPATVTAVAAYGTCPSTRGPPGKISPSPSVSVGPVEAVDDQEGPRRVEDGSSAVAAGPRRGLDSEGVEAGSQRRPSTPASRPRGRPRRRPASAPPLGAGQERLAAPGGPTIGPGSARCVEGPSRRGLHCGTVRRRGVEHPFEATRRIAERQIGHVSPMPGRDAPRTLVPMNSDATRQRQ